MIKRQGADYLDKTLPQNPFPSASAIRNHLTQSPTQFLTLLQELTSYLPPATLEILQDEYNRGQAPVFPEQLTSQLMTLLRRTTKRN